MIQRKQTIYLALVALLSVIFAIWGVEWLYVENDWIIISGFLFSTILSIASILMYKNRNLQIKIGILNITLNFFIVGFLVYSLSKLPGGITPEKGIGLLMSFVLIGLLIVANRYISKDEKLVKSIDRFR